MRREAKKHGPDVIDKALEIHSWFDPVFFAPMIKGEVRLTAGGCDLSCPAASIYTLYNALSPDITKNIIFYPSGTHGSSTADPEAREKMNRIIAGNITGSEKK
jgi:cephalosporin-C deacetylase-like acetyl esterase